MKNAHLASALLASVAAAACQHSSHDSAPATEPAAHGSEATPAVPPAAMKKEPASNAAPAAQPVKSLASFETKTLEGAAAPLAQWNGKVVLVVNTASACGYTKQYAGLEKLHEEYAARGFAVLGFPCNDFGGQEPGSAAEIRTFCTDKFQVTFPLYEKVSVKAGAEQAPLYTWLGEKTGQLPSWNFCKYLIGRDGQPIQFWSSKTAPDAAELRSAIDAALAAK